MKQYMKYIGKNQVIFKIVFKKAYHEINWPFVQQTIQMNDLSPTWCKWIACFIEVDHVGIKINDHVGSNFQTRKGLRQGDQLSPILFNLVWYASKQF
jgi:hypothetical protein